MNQKKAPRNNRLIGDNHQERVRQAPVVASLFALVLVVSKLSMGLYSGAVVLIASAVDSGLDLLVSLFNYYAIRVAEKPSDQRFNYGRGKLKAIASTLEGMLIAISSLFIFYTAIAKLIRGGELTRPGIAIYVMLASTLLTWILVLYLNRVVAATRDLVIRADALHYKMDLFTNLAILSALGLIYLTGWQWLDPVFSLFIAIYIIKEAWGLIHEGVMMLMDRALSPELVDQIVNVLENTSPLVNGWHQLRTRRSADVIFVDVHLVFDKKISLAAAHQVSEKIEAEIAALAGESWVINCHLDPVDDSRKDRLEQPF